MRDTGMQTEDDFLRSHLVAWTRCLHQQDGSFEYDDLLSCKLFSSLMKAIWPPCAENETLFQQLASPGQYSPSSASSSVPSSAILPDLSSSTPTLLRDAAASSSFQIRYNKWATLVRTLITFYEIALQQLVLMAPPNVMILASSGGRPQPKKSSQNGSSSSSSNGHHHHLNHHQTSSSELIRTGDHHCQSLHLALSGDVRRELEVTLRLILGCAVQAETTKEIVISYVTTLDLHVQDALRLEIESITHNRSNVFPLECLTLVAMPSQTDLNDLKDAARCLSRLVSERNDLLAACQRLSYLEEMIKANGHHVNGNGSCKGDNHRPPSPGSSNGSDNQVIERTAPEDQAKLYLQVSEMKNKLRQCQSELEAKTEVLENVREELDERISLVEKMRLENADLQREARLIRELRDELDAAKQDSARAERLERENAKLREKTNEFEAVKKRLDEIREENKVLVEVRTGLERKLEEAGTGRSALSRIAAAEAEADRRRKEVAELRTSYEASQRLAEDLNARCARLTSELAVANEKNNSNNNRFASNSGSSSNADSGTFGEEKSFSEQLEESVTTRLLTLELENERLLREMDEARQRFSAELDAKSEKAAELERDLEHMMFDKNEILQDREKIRHLLDRVKDGYDSKLRMAFSLIAVIKQELLATPYNGGKINGGSKQAHRNAKIICELLDQFSADLRAPVLTGDNEPNIYVDEKLYAKMKDLMVNSDCLQNLENEVLRLTEDVKSLTSEKESALAECKRLESEGGCDKIRELNEQRVALTDERDLLNTRLTRCLETIEFLQKRQDKLIDEKQQLQTQLSESEEVVGRLKQCLNSNNEALRLAEEEGNRLKSMLERVNSCMDQFFGLKGGIQELAERLQQDDGPPRFVESLVAASRWSDPKVKELDEKVRDLRTQNQNLERELNIVRVEEGRRTGDLARDVVSMKNRLVELERQNASLASENGSLKTHSCDLQRQLRDASEQLTELQSIRSELLAERARLETELGTTDDRIAGLLADREQYQMKANELEVEKGSLKQEIATLARQISDFRDENGRLQNEIASQGLSARSAMAECRVFAEQAKRAQAETDQLREAIENVQRSSSDSTAMLAQLQAENQELVLQRATLQNDHARLEEKFKQVFQDLRKYQAVNPEALLAKIEYLRQMNDRLESAVQDMSDQMRLLLKHNEDLLNGKLKDSEKHNTEQKYYMEMLATVQRQKTTLEGKMYELWQEQQDKQRRRTSSHSLEQLVRKAKHLFNKNGAQTTNGSMMTNGRIKGGESALLTAPPSSDISPMFLNQQHGVDSASLHATDSASTTSASDSISMDHSPQSPEAAGEGDPSVVSAPADENHGVDELGGDATSYHNSSFLMSRSLSIDLFKTSSPLKSSASISNGIQPHLPSTSSQLSSSLLVPSSQQNNNHNNGNVSVSTYGGAARKLNDSTSSDSRQTTLANVGRWVAVERPNVNRPGNGSDSCSTYSDSSLRAFNGSDGSAKMKNPGPNGTASTRTLTANDATSAINIIFGNNGGHSTTNGTNGYGQQHHHRSSSTSSSGTTSGASVSLPGMGGVPSLASAVAVVTIPAGNGHSHSLLSPALSSSASGQSDDAIRPSLPGGTQMSDEGSVWYEFGCV